MIEKSEGKGKRNSKNDKKKIWGGILTRDKIVKL